MMLLFDHVQLQINNRAKLEHLMRQLEGFDLVLLEQHEVIDRYGYALIP